jgi:ATP-dependent Zn protease
MKHIQEGECKYMETKVFNSIIGYDEVKDELSRILDQLNNPEIYKIIIFNKISIIILLSIFLLNRSDI